MTCFIYFTTAGVLFPGTGVFSEAAGSAALVLSLLCLNTASVLSALVHTRVSTLQSCHCWTVSCRSSGRFSWGNRMKRLDYSRSASPLIITPLSLSLFISLWQVQLWWISRRYTRGFILSWRKMWVQNMEGEKKFGLWLMCFLCRLTFSNQPLVAPVHLSKTASL